MMSKMKIVRNLEKGTEEILRWRKVKMAEQLWYMSKRKVEGDTLRGYKEREEGMGKKEWKGC